MSRIFLSYRRDDSGGYAGGLSRDLRKRFGSDLIFTDIDTIEAGVDFVEAIENAVQSCDVLLVLIGRQWLIAVDEKGRRRLDDPNDYVRLEISAALKRNIRVIPLLVQNAAMPSIEDLPEDLVALTRRQALQIADGRWEYDIEQLIEILQKVLKVTPNRTTNPGTDVAPLPQKQGLFFRWVLPCLSVLSWGLALLLTTSSSRGERELSPFFFIAGLLGILVWIWWLWIRKRPSTKSLKCL
jgi:hypothetical protein